MEIVLSPAGASEQTGSVERHDSKRDGRRDTPIVTVSEGADLDDERRIAEAVELARSLVGTAAERDAHAAGAERRRRRRLAALV